MRTTQRVVPDVERLAPVRAVQLAVAVAALASRLRDLLGRISCGDEAAFADFYDATSCLVYGMALSGLGDGARAADVTAQVYVQAWTSAPAFDSARVEPSLWLACLTAREIDVAHRRPRPLLP
jgi:DNA-directed RNA polymerase specialized sigma24 family protein